MKIQRTPIASAVALLLMGAILPAQAQTVVAPAAAASAPKAEPKQLETVIITGIRGSLQQSINQKRNSDSIVEVITAEDIGKMPDKNVADSLQRIPGVNVATAGGTEGGFGENDRVSLRGTPSALTLTTLNGHSVSSGDWFADNIVGGGRSVSYSLLPSELIKRVTVYKGGQANVLEGGATGVVDIETRKPLDFKNSFSGSVSLGAVNSSLSKKTDPQVSALLNWKNTDSTLGVMLQLFDQKRTLRRDGQEFLWWDTLDANAPDIVAASPGLKGKYISLLTGSAWFEQKRERKGGLLDVEFKVNNQLKFDVSGFASRLNAPNVNHNYMQVPISMLSNTWAGGGIVPTYTVTGNTVTSISFPTTCPIADCSRMSSSVQDIFARPVAYADSKFFNVDVEYKASNKLVFNGKLGTTKGTGHTESVGFEIWSPYAGGSYELHGINGPATVVVPGSNVYTNGGANGHGISTFGSTVTSVDKEDYAQLDGKYMTDWASLPTVRFGVRAANHSRSLEFIPIQQSPAGNEASFPTAALTNFPSNFGSSLGGGILAGAWTLPLSAVDAWAKTYTTFSGHGLQNEFNIKEPTMSGYLMADLSSDSIQGNFGVRVVRTQEKVGKNVPDSTGGYTPTVIENTYWDVLPSANLRMDLTKDLVGRFAVSRTMARPELGQMAGLDLRDIQKTGTIGNANLKPIRSNNSDVALEWYFAPKSMVSVDAFYMAIDSYVTFGSGTGTFYNQSAKAFTVYNVSQPVNTTAEVHGLEFSYIQALPGGFGVNANYTYTKGRETGKAPASACADTGNCDMIGLSRNSYNVGAFFENDKFSARVAYNYRSTYLNGIDRRSAVYQLGVGTVSASLNYNVTKNITLSLEGKDLNDPLLRSYATSPDQPRAFYKNGRQIYFGLRASI